MRHLIRQLEKEGRPARLSIPDWLLALIDEVSQLFEPYRGVARAGYECVQVGREWEISLYLGATETMGGAEDGRRAPINFRFDLKGLLGQFDAVHTYLWNALPECGDFFEDESMVSFVTLEGEKKGTTIRLQIHATSPMESGPGLRQFPDGQVAVV